jgi:hypothetical protein
MKKIFIPILCMAILISGCAPAATSLPTQPPTQPTQASNGTAGDLVLDYSTVAQNVTLETVPAQAATVDAPFWEGAPAYRLMTLQGYPVANHQRKPQIFIYPVGEMASANENMSKVAADLQTLLQTHKAGTQLPFLPLGNEGQLIRARMEFLDFKSGKGVQFLTQLAQGMGPINNYELIYSFQGLTSDGKYYISAILPVTNSELPADARAGEEQNQTLTDYQVYRSSMITLLDQQPAGSFTPDLSKLDALIRSIEVK